MDLLPNAMKCIGSAIHYFRKIFGEVNSAGQTVKYFEPLVIFDPIYASTTNITGDDVAKLEKSLIYDSDTIRHLIGELAIYQTACAADIKEGTDLIRWWGLQARSLPWFSSAASKAMLLQPSSAAIERAFSMLRIFSEQQSQTLEDYRETALMLRYNTEV